MNIILFDQQEVKAALLPFTFTRPVAAIRVGIFTIAEKWQHATKSSVAFHSDIISDRFPLKIAAENCLINGAFFPDQQLLAQIEGLKLGEGLMYEGKLLAFKADENTTRAYFDTAAMPAAVQFKSYGESPLHLSFAHDIFRLNGEAIRRDYAQITQHRESLPLTDPHTIVYGKENIFIEEGVNIKAAVLNAEDGPIYLGKNSSVAEGALIKGPFALCENAAVNMGAKVRGDTTVGPYSKIGGEVSNAVLFAYSNKGHDGFLGNSVIGEWCNLGADTNTSNLKNNYANVKIWSFADNKFADTGLQFCGLLMGDHAKCGIYTMFNTGTVVGVGANIFGDGFPRTFIPSFSWGGASGFTTFQLKKFFEVAEKVMARRGKALSSEERETLVSHFEDSGIYRTWEKQAI